MSTTTTRPTPGASTSAAAALAADQRFVDLVLNKHDLEAINELVAEDFVEQNPVPGQGPGRDGLRDFLGQMFTAFPDLQWDVREVIADGERVAAWSTWTGTHLGDFMGIPATGRTVSVEAWTFDYIREGKLAESRIIMDALGMLTQLGAIPSSGPGDTANTANTIDT